VLESFPGGEAGLRVGVFLAVLAVVAVIETMMPRRPLRAVKTQRWTTNFGLVVIDSIAVRLLVPLAAMGVAALAAERGFGLLHWISVPSWLSFVIALVVLDFAIWLQHLVAHKVPILWRLHQVHHADVDFDVSTALRFHPIEILASMLWKMLVVAAIGAPVMAVLVFEVVLNAMAMFNHGNIRLPRALDAVLRLFVVTPDMHRVHHSVIRRETDSNYGFNLSLWDRLFRTYRAQPKYGHDGMTIGLESYQDAGPSRLGWSLILPFRATADDGKEVEHPAE